MKAFLFQKPLFIIFFNYPKFKFCWFFVKTSPLRWKRHLQEILSFLWKICHLRKFWKKTSFFEKTYLVSKKPQICTFWEILLFQSHFTANLLWVGDEKISRSENVRPDISVRSRTLSIGKSAQKNFVPGERFSSNIINMAEDNKKCEIWAVVFFFKCLLKFNCQLLLLKLKRTR